MAIIKSLLDTDLYKFTMWQVALHQFATTHVKYEFKCRNKAKWTDHIVEEINKEVDAYCTLQFTDDELSYLGSLGYFKESFLNFLSLYKPNRNHISIELCDDKLEITAEGPWFLTIPFEVPVLAIVNEVYFRETGNVSDDVMRKAGEMLGAKKALLADKKEFSVSDFGTRRRYSRDWHGAVVKELCDLPVFSGTSNVALAKELNITAIGTMAHEFMMVGQAQDDVPVSMFQKKMLQAWVDEYRGDLGIALSDTVGIDAFLRDFDKYFAKLYDGLRHDSGDPVWWAEKVLKHYESLGVNAENKILVFSDGLNPQKAVDIYKQLKGRCKLAFGIGTNLTNDIPGVEPLQIVMKIVSVNGKPVAKISDSPGKGMCKDESFLAYLKQQFNIV